MQTFSMTTWVCLLALMITSHMCHGDEAQQLTKAGNGEHRQADMLPFLLEADMKLVSTVRCLAQKVGFTATLRRTGFTRVRGGRTVVYDRLLSSNVGAAYNTWNGHFTAPTPGLYGFTVTSFSPNNNQITNLNIKVNDDIIASEFTNNRGGDSNNSGTARVVVELSKGDVVMVEADDSWSTHSMYQAGSSRVNLNTFSGELITPDCPQ